MTPISPTYNELKTQFDVVSDLFQDDRKWKNHPSVTDEATVDRMKLVHFNREITSEDIIVVTRKQDIRPATHTELIAWAKENPYKQLKYSIVAIGSCTVHGAHRRVAMLYSDSGRRILSHHWFRYTWHPDKRFLFVCKESVAQPLCSCGSPSDYFRISMKDDVEKSVPICKACLLRDMKK